MAPFPFVNAKYVQSYTFRDAKGNTARFTTYLDTVDLTVSQALGQTIGGHLVAISNAALQAAHGLYAPYGPAQYGTHATSGAYESVIEKAVLVFQDLTGQLHRFEVPAPKISIFLADKITVDPANAGVANLIADMTGGLVYTRQGQVFANYMGGYFRARKIRRRTNVLTLTPPLTASEPAE